MLSSTLWQKRQISLSGDPPGCSLRWLLKSLECQHKDELRLLGEDHFAGEPVLGYATKFSDGLHGNLLAVGNEEGFVQFMDTRKPLSEAVISKIRCHRNTVDSLAWLNGGSKLLTGSGDQTVCLWDVTSGSCLGTFSTHRGRVKTVDAKTDEQSVFVSGDQWGCICVWDTRCSKAFTKPYNVIYEAHTPEAGCENRSVTAALFHRDHKIASVGSADRAVKVWDTRRIYPPSMKKLPKPLFSFKQEKKGFVSLATDDRHSSLYAACSDNNIYRYMDEIPEPVATYRGAIMSSFFIRTCLSPDGKYLLSGSGCGNGFIWEVDSPELSPLKLTGTDKDEVMGVAWCRSLDKLVTTAINSKVQIWRVRREKGPRDVTGTCEDTSIGADTPTEGGQLTRRFPVLSIRTPPTTTPMVTAPTPMATTPTTPTCPKKTPPPTRTRTPLSPLPTQNPSRVTPSRRKRKSPVSANHTIQKYFKKS